MPLDYSGLEVSPIDNSRIYKKEELSAESFCVYSYTALLQKIL